MEAENILKQVYAGRPFRNNLYEDTGRRYKVKVNNLGQKYIVLVGDWFDLNNRTTIYTIDKIIEDVIFVDQAYSRAKLTINIENIDFS